MPRNRPTVNASCVNQKLYRRRRHLQSKRTIDLLRDLIIELPELLVINDVELIERIVISCNGASLVILMTRLRILISCL